MYRHAAACLYKIKKTMLEQLKQKFKEEVYELLDTLETVLLKLEKNTADEKKIQEVFRIMHTIKGAAGMYEFHTTVELTHNLENIYSFIRDKEIILSTKIISLTFESIDYIRKLISNDDNKNQNGTDFTKFITKIKKLNTELIPKKQNKDDDIISFFDEEEQEPKKITDVTTYYILFRPEANINDRGLNLNSLVREIKNFNAHVITYEHSQPKEMLLKNKFMLFWEFFIQTKKSKDEIDELFIFVEDEVEITKLCNSNLLDHEVFINFLNKNFKASKKYDLLKLQKFSQTFSYKKQIKELQEKLNLETELLEAEEKEENNDEIFEEKILQQEVLITKQRTKNIKVSAKRLDELMYYVSDLIVANAEIGHIANESKNPKIIKAAEKLNKISQNLKRNALKTRLIPLKTVMFRFERLVRDLSVELNKKVNFIVEGAETELDKNIVDNLSIPLMHLIRNAIDHGIETPELRKNNNKSEIGLIRFKAFYSGSNVIIQVRDDGKGIDPEIIFKKAVEKKIIEKTDNLTRAEINQLLFLPGFSTAQKITGISGRGVGMDAIQQSIQDLRGDIEINSEINLGTSITIKLPLTLSIIETMLVSIEDTKFLIPTSNIISCGKHKHNTLMKYHNQRLVSKEKLVPFIYLRKKFEFSGKPLDSERIIFIQHNDKMIALVFDKILGEHQAVTKPLGEMLNKQDFISGGSILADGTVALILDTYKLIKQFI